jgi:phage baseplate assembly protein gpV
VPLPGSGGSFEITVNGAPLSPEQYDPITLVSVRLGLDTSGHARIEFQSEDVAPSPFEVGKKLVVKLAAEGSEATAPVFEGTILGVGCEMMMGFTRIGIDAYDASYKLGRTTKIATHVNVTYADVLGKIADDAGLTRQISGLPTTMFETVQQFGTPHQFIGRIVRAAGCEWMVTGNKLIVRKRTQTDGSVVLTAGKDLQSFRARYTASEEAASVEVRGWNPADQEPVVGRSTAPTVHSDAAIVTSSKAKAEPAAAVSWTRTPIDPSDANDMATALGQWMDDTRITGRGVTFCNPSVAPGASVEIANFGASFSGKYRVAEVEHVLQAGEPSLTKFTVGGSEPASLVDLLGDGPAPSSGHFLGGVTVGVVTNLEDPKAFNRVKVQLPYLTSQEETGWARVVQLGAGNGRGWWLHPDVGDEVIVAFENGDPRLPIVIGGVWSSKNAGPDSARLASSKLENRSYTSASKHLLDFRDKSGETSIKIMHGSKQTSILFDENTVVVDAADVPLELKNANGFVKIAANGAMTIESKDSITIKATKDVTIEGMNVNIKGQQNLVAEAGMDAKVKATMATIEGSATTTVKGGMVNIN